MGAQLALHFAGQIFKYVLLVVLPILTFFTLRKKGSKTCKNKELKLSGTIDAKLYLLVMLLAITVGLYDGFFGPGTGTFYTLGLTFIGLPMLKACGTTRFINLASNIAALTTFIINGNIIYKLGIPCVIASIIGNLVGSEFALKKGDKGIRPIILVVIALLYVKILFDLFL